LGFTLTQHEQQVQADEQREKIASRDITLANGQKLDQKYLSTLSNAQVGTLAGQLANQEQDEQWDGVTRMLGIASVVGVGKGALSRDATGKVHGDLPDHVPEYWTREQLEETADELKGSIRQRNLEQQKLGDEGAHRAASGKKSVF
jgi:hypothetical protein